MIVRYLKDKAIKKFKAGIYRQTDTYTDGYNDIQTDRQTDKHTQKV